MADSQEFLQLKKDFQALKQEFENFKRNEFAIHQHTNSDGTSRLRKNIVLDQDQYLTVGSSQMYSKQSYSVADGLVYEGIIEAGSQMEQTTTVQSPNMRVVLKQFEAVSADISEFYGHSNPLVFPYENTSISTTAGGSTVTINGYNFGTNTLNGSVINIYDSTGALVESQVVSSNTSTVITITDTWINSTSGGQFKIYNRVALGSTENVWERVHLWTGSSGGIWFGSGNLLNGQVSNLFVNPTTYDLTYTYPFGMSGIVNLTAGAGVSDTFTTVDGKTVTVEDGIITDIT